MNALIIVDMQNDFLPGGSLAVPNGDQIIPVINRLSLMFDLVVATQDWHPAGHKSFASAHAGKQVFEQIELEGLPQVLWPDHCIQGSAGAAFSTEIIPHPIEAIFRKGTDPGIDSYSAFYDNGHRKNTGLAGYLRDRAVEQVFVCGLAADYCVYFTASDALQEGFRTTIITDATKAIDQEGFERAKQDILNKGGYLAQSKELGF